MRDNAKTPVPEETRRRGILSAIEDRIAAAFGVGPEDRRATIQSMLARGGRIRAGYWLQLLLAMAIATLGLLLDSTAVVIGAMLIAPLMTPLIELGMGLAVGSPLLVVRSTMRVAASVVVVVMGAAALTLVVPIREVTREIAARTAPTLLDLAIASGCALAALYATVRTGSDTASTAAGTSVGIALVPPLCVVGYGIGTRDASIGLGAALLFTANLSAIVLFSVLGFVVFGYGQVAIGRAELAELADSPPESLLARLVRRVSGFFASKLGPLVRLAMPIALAVAISVPLRRALAEVTWEVRVRAAAQAALATIANASVESSVRVDRHRVSVRVIAIGSASDRDRITRQLSDRIAAVAGLPPSIEVVLVPDAAALAEAERALAPRPIAPPPAGPDLPRVRTALEQAMGNWPAEAAGPLLSWTLSVGSTGDPQVEVLHVGAPLGGAGVALLEAAISERVRSKVRVHDTALSLEVSVAESQGEWLGRTAAALSMLRAHPAAPITLCLVAARDVDALADARAHVTKGDRWSLRWSTTGCEQADAGADADASP